MLLKLVGIKSVNPNIKKKTTNKRVCIIIKKLTVDDKLARRSFWVGDI